jgi:hypothetical protein
MLASLEGFECNPLIELVVAAHISTKALGRLRPSERIMNWESYDPTWLVELAQETCPDVPWLAAALRHCTRAARESRAYLHFVDPANANVPGSEWQLVENIVLDHPTEGSIVLDILTNRRVGGVEFLSRL